MTKISNKYAYLIFPALAVLTLVLSIWKGFHGITMHDDAWYLFLLRDGYISASQYNLLFHNIFNGDIVMIKMTEVVLEMIGSGVFSYGLWHYHKEEKKLAQKDFVCLFSIVYISSSLFCILLTVVSYITLIGTIYYMAIGLCLYALSVKSRVAKSVLYIMAGMFCGLSPFVMITTTPLIVVLWGFVFVCEKREFRYYSILTGIVGIVFTCILFFRFCLPLQDYISLVTNKASLAINGGLDSTHGLKQIVLWIYQSITRYYLSEVFVGLMFVIGCFCSLSKLSSKYKTILLIAIGCLALYYYYTSIWRKGYSVAAVLPFYIFAALCIVKNIQRDEKTSRILLYILLFFTPFFLSMGTDTTLSFRSYWYMGFVLPIIYLSVDKRTSMMNVFILLVLVYWCTTTMKITKNNWGWLTYSEQTEDIRKLGLSQHQYVDKNTYQNLETLKEYINPQDKLIIAEPLLWGYIYLLDASPLTYDYRQNDVFVELAKDTNSSVKMVDNVWKPFRETYVDSVRVALQKDTIYIYSYNNGYIYAFE